MLERIIRFAIAHRWLMLLLTLALIALGAWSFRQLPIDATPDITNVQVQINTEAPGYSPLEAEQRVTFPIETAMAGLPAWTTRARCRATGCRRSPWCSRTAPTCTSPASRSPSACSRSSRSCPPGLEPEMGPIATGLGEIFMYTVEAEPDARKPDGTPWTATDLRTLQDWVCARNCATRPA
jgi:cobalt-zinc-cadmium resistance protein CzcA